MIKIERICNEKTNLKWYKKYDPCDFEHKQSEEVFPDIIQHSNC